MGKEQLKDRLKNARKKLKVEKENPQTSNIGQAFKLSTELVAAVLVGTIIGFILDNWFDTKPWLIIIFTKRNTCLKRMLKSEIFQFITENYSTFLTCVSKNKVNYF